MMRFMGDVRSAAVVLVTAMTTGAVLAQRAGAVTPPASPPAPAEAATAAPSSPSATASPSSARDDDEHADRDDSRPSEGSAGNPYEEAAPVARAQSARIAISVPQRDGMLRLPGARFVMGSASGWAPVNERPARSTTVPSFWIDRTEVTVGAYRACVDAGACARPERSSATCTFDADDPELPVSCVHWRDAFAYCRFAGKRLPSEAEWEYAARGQNALPFPWCTNAVVLLNVQSGRGCAPRPARVGTHPAGASVFGVQDMSGNVEEWTSDWYAELVGPSPRAGVAHVLRGGGWLSTAAMSRTTSRDWGSALEAGPNVGLRCARDDP
jgi:formylglycine-generating enzyme required for sulfatase activity